MRSVQPADAFDRAFSLALFIHQDRALSVRIATEALDSLPLACADQRKRGSYRRGSLKRGITKVSGSDLQLLQSLVYIESGKREVEQETSAASSITDRDRVVRFIEYLARISTRMSSFYVACAFGRILYSYSTSEIRNVYETMTNQFKDDSEYRKKKLLMMDDITTRFRGALSVEAGLDDEHRFRSVPDATAHHALVGECLAQFSPWDTNCILASQVTLEAVAELFHGPAGSDPGYSEVEMKRFHALIDLRCFHRLTGAFGLDPPFQRLSLPLFRESRND
jgi:hypothetical protein